LETSATSMVQGFTRRVLPWRSATRGNWIRLCWLTAAGSLK
jgi:hypothetical protein